MIEYLWQFAGELWTVFETNFDPIWDTIDILLLTLAFYWLLLLIRGTRAVQILVGLLVLFALSLASEAFDFSALGLILRNFLGSAVVIMVVLFQQDIRRALARVGRGFFPNVSAQQESQIVEEVIKEVPIYLNPSGSSTYIAPTSNFPVKPATSKQVNYCRLIAARKRIQVPPEVLQDTARASVWIDDHKD